MKHSLHTFTPAMFCVLGWIAGYAWRGDRDHRAQRSQQASAHHVGLGENRPAGHQGEA